MLKTITAAAVLLFASQAVAADLKIEDLEVGTGATATPGSTVTVDYTGWLEDGTKFDSSLDRNDPFTFQLGAGRVIKGWDQGIEGMKEGGVRKLTIPPEMAYGNRAVGGGLIPANSTLIFEVELHDVDK
ncbi:MAG: peptidylprolyl isomerase [Rhodospirillaceae bacterium]|nr:peptidylprolyl isomerase [Rhodospirillaceae bacterium]